MKKFILQLSWFVGVNLLLFLLLLVFSNTYINKKSDFKIDEHIKYAFFGHSHSEGAINDSLIENSKNFSRGGEHYFYTYLKVKKLLKENKGITHVFLEFTNNSISQDVNDWITKTDKNGTFLPYFAPVMTYEEHLLVFRVNPLGYIKAQGAIFHKNLNSILFRKKNFLKERDWGGYYFNSRAKVDSLLKTKLEYNNGAFRVNEDNLVYIDKIKEICDKCHVKLILLRSPQHASYRSSQNENVFLTILKKRFGNTSFIDFNTFALKNEEFADLEHLNYKGAKKFSIFLNHFFKKNIENDLLSH
jgi:hypothetical protein